jgi:hypothetical protein
MRLPEHFADDRLGRARLIREHLSKTSATLSVQNLSTHTGLRQSRPCWACLNTTACCKEGFHRRIYEEITQTCATRRRVLVHVLFSECRDYPLLAQRINSELWVIQPCFKNMNAATKVALLEKVLGYDMS